MVSARAGFLPVLGCLTTLLAASDALAINWTNAPDAQTITAGNDMSQAMAVDTSANWSLQRMDMDRGLCSTSMSSLALPIGFGLDSTLTIGDKTRAFTWTKETNHAGVGSFCVRVKVCEYFNSATCIQKTVAITVSDGGNADAILTPHRYTARENNTTATRMRFEPQYTRITSTTALSTMLSVASCPAGATGCSGTTLPSWVSFAYDDNGLYFDAKPPFGARGDWTFTATLPLATSVTKPFYLKVLDSSRVDPEMKPSALAYIETGWLELDRHYPEEEASNDDASTAPYIERGWVIGDVSPAGDVDLFQFYVAGGARHAFHASDRKGTGCNFDLAMSVHRVESDGTLSAALSTATGSGPGACATLPPQSLPDGETYVLQVQENGDDAIGYEYVIEHLIYEEEGEEGANTSTNLNQGDLLGYWFEGEQLYEPGLWGTLTSSDYDWAAINLRAGDKLTLETSNGNGGCSGDTYMVLYRYDSGTEELVAVGSNDDSGYGSCSALSYTASQTRENLWVRVSVAGKSFTRGFSYFLEAKRVPSEHNSSAFSWSTGLTDSTHSYDRYECGGVAFFLDDFIHNADWFAGYAGYTSNPSCGNEQGATFESDGMGVCRERGMGFLSSGFWDLDDTRHGTRLAYTPYSPIVLGTPQRAHVIAHRADTSLSSSAKGALVSASFTSSGVHMFYEPYGQCDTQTYPSSLCVDGIGLGGSTTKSECIVNSSFYYEGERAVLDLTRYRSFGTLTLSKCNGTSDDTCGLTLPSGASLSGNRFLWDIPYDAAQTTRFPYESTYRFKVAWSYGANYYIQLRVRNRSASSSGADLNISEIREEHPLGYQAEDVRLTKAAYRAAKSRHQENLTRSAYLTNTQYGRSLARYDRIHVHPSFENGRYGDSSGPATLHVRVENDGTLSSSSTTVEAYLMPAYANSSGGLTSSAPGTDDVPYRTQSISGLGAGGSTSVQLAFPAADALTSFGHEPWEGGAQALWLKIAGGDAYTTNNTVGPYFFTPAKTLPLATLCQVSSTSPGFSGSTCAAVDVTGEIATVSPASPKEGDTVTVNVQYQFQGSGWGSSSVLHFWSDLATTPSSSTTPDASASFPSSPTQGVIYGHSFTFTAQKPNRTDNALDVRAFLDATDQVAESGSGEANNHLPSASTAHQLVIANSLPTFSSVAPTTATEDLTYSYQVKIQDNDDVDFSRLTLSLDTAPAGMAWSTAIATCPSESTKKCRTLSWVPDDDDALTGPHYVSVAACDGDPVAGGAGGCTTQNWLVDVTRVDDPPQILVTTPYSPPPTTATEDSLYSYTVTAYDEEDGVLGFSLPVKPPGSGAHTMTLAAQSGTTALIEWTPDDYGVGTKNVTVRVTDYAAQTADYSWQITTANVNDNPTLGAPSATTGSEGTAYSASLAIADVDNTRASQNQTFSCSLLSSPSWLSASRSSTNCLVSGTPGNLNTGSQLVTVRVDDSAGGYGTRSYTLTISDAINDAPDFATISSPQSATQDALFSLTVGVTDEDFDSPGYAEDLTFSKVAGPGNLSLSDNGESVTVSFTPTSSQVKTHTVTIGVSDKRGGSDEVTFSITVANVNDAPVLASLSDATISEGASYAAAASATDADISAGLSDSLTYEVVSGAPPGFNIDASTGAMTLGSTDDAHVGVWNITIGVSDESAARDEETFALTIENVEEAPVLAAVEDQGATEDASWSYDIDATDPDPAATLTYRKSAGPSGAAVDSNTGVITWTPVNADVGTHTFTVEVEDETLRSDTVTFDVTVANVNDAPTITSTAITTASEESLYSYTLSSSDVDVGDSATSSATVLPAWLTFNAATGVLSGTPDDPEVGVAHAVTLVVDDGEATATQSFSISVSGVNDAPVLVAVGNKSVPEGDVLSFSVSATDADGTTPAITLSSPNLPGAAVFSGDTLTWDTSFGDEGTYSATFTASDGAAFDSETITITVGNVNRPPVLDLIGNKTIAEGATLSFTVTASDPDGTTPTLSAVGGVSDPFSAGATFSPSTGVFSWSPGYDRAGTWQLTFSADDGELADSEAITITVSDTNRSPSFTASPTTTTAEDALYSYTASATDPDADSLGWTLTTGPSGMTLVATTGAVSWTPSNAQVGDHAVSITVTDGNGGAAVQSYTLTVTNVNDLPVFTTSPVTSVSEGVSYAYTCSASDIDAGAALTYSAPTKPSWLTFTASTCALAGATDDPEVGSHAVTLRATDDTGAYEEQSFTITVNAVNDAPVLVGPTPSGTLVVAEGSELAFTVTATDPDGPSLSYDVTGRPAEATFDAATGVFSWTPGYDDAGSRLFTLVASDSLASASRQITVEVSNTDRPPVLTVPASASGAEGTTISFDVSGSDPDGDLVTVTLLSGPPGASFASGTFTWTPGYDDAAGSFAATFRAAAGGRTDDEIVPITVTDTNRAPVVTSTPLTTATEDQPYSYTFTASDPDGDTVTRSFVAGPSNATFDAATGGLAWTPTGAQTGERTITLRADDGRGAVTDHVFTVTVTAVNDVPVITSTALTSATEDQAYSYDANASDEDGDTLTWSLVSSPSGMVINGSSGLVTWTPGNAAVGTHSVTVRVSDGSGGVAEQSYSLAVANVNDAPVIAASPSPPSSVLEDNVWTWTPAVSDVDVGDTVTLSLVESPVGMALTDGVLSWSPQNDDVGTHTVRLRATDAAGATATKLFSVEVINRNDAPFFISAVLDGTIAEGNTFVASVIADDVDVGDALVYTLIGAPAKMTIDADTGQLVFSPDDAEVGSHAFTVRVEDQAGGYAEQAGNVVVTAVNDPPVLAPIGNRQVDPGVELTFTLAATDPDGPSLSYSMSGAPVGATLEGAVFRWTPSASQLGGHSLTFRVTDASLSDTEAITIVVGDGGLPPSLTLPEDANLDEGQQLTGLVSATDPEGGSVTLSVEGDLPAGAQFDPTPGAFTWVPSYDQAGSYEVIFVATSSSGISRGTWNILVRDVNRAPFFTTVALAPALENVPYGEDLEALDDDGDGLSFSLISGPSGLTVAAAGTITFTPSFEHIGLRQVRVRVADGRGGLDERTFDLLVQARDDDGDGLPDTWEGLNGTDPTVDDASEDPDGDGLTNLDEYREGKDPFVSNAPTAPLLIAPSDGVRVSTARPTLVAGEATDPDGDPLVYLFEIMRTDDPDVVAWGIYDVVSADGEVSAAVDVDLDEGVGYLWRVFASDGDGLSPEAEVRSFLVDAVNEAPSAPSIVAPLDGATVTDVSPTLRVGPASDPDGDELAYFFEVFETLGGPAIITSSAITPPLSGDISFPLPVVLVDGDTRFWRAYAVDARGLFGSATTTARFDVDLTNLPPPAPAIVSPSEGEVVTSLPVLLTAEEVADPEGLLVSYLVEIAPSEAFLPAETTSFSGVVTSAGQVVADAGSRSDGPWSWRIRASDGATWSEPQVASFVVDTINDPPSAPAPISPEDNSLVTTLPVELVVAAATDPEGEILSYRFELVTTDGLTLLEQLAGVLDEDDGADDGVVRAAFDGLGAGQRYGWRVRAEEPSGGASPYSALYTFRVEGTNVRPTAPELLSPEEGAVVTVAQPAFAFGEAADADGDALLHDFEVYVDDVLIYRAEDLIASAGEVAVTPPTPLPSGAGRWRARGRDPTGGGPWAERTLTIDVPAPPDAGPEGDAGDDDAGAPSGDAGAPDDDGGPSGEEDAGAAKPGTGLGPVVVDMGGDPAVIPAGCGCSSDGGGGPSAPLALFVLSLYGLARLRRRNR